MVESPDPLRHPPGTEIPLHFPVGESSDVSQPSSAKTIEAVTAIWKKVCAGQESVITLKTTADSTITALKKEQGDALFILREAYNKKGYNPVDWFKHLWNTWRTEQKYTSMITTINGMKNTKGGTNIKAPPPKPPEAAADEPGIIERRESIPKRPLVKPISQREYDGLSQEQRDALSPAQLGEENEEAWSHGSQPHSSSNSTHMPDNQGTTTVAPLPDADDDPDRRQF